MISREARLLEENDALRQRVAELEALTLNRFEFPEAWRLPPSSTRLLSSFMAAEFLSRKQIELLFSGERRGSHAGYTQISLLRRRLQPFRVTIENVYGVGYRITPADKVKLRRYATENK